MLNKQYSFWRYCLTQQPEPVPDAEDDTKPDMEPEETEADHAQKLEQITQHIQYLDQEIMESKRLAMEKEELAKQFVGLSSFFLLSIDQGGLSVNWFFNHSNMLYLLKMSPSP